MSNIVKSALKLMESTAKEAGDQFLQTSFTKNFCRLHLGYELDEVFSVVFLDNQNRLLSCENIFRGTINQAPIYPRAIVRKVIEHNSAAVVLMHNHPSGHINPSESDINATEDIKKILEIIDCKVIDHIIVGRGGAFSFAENNYL
jgi:DNA repair protein RadC